MAISNWMASLALINSTTGGIILVLPIIGLQAGWLMIPIIITLSSLCCYYTATLMFMHFGTASTINKCILNHFDNLKYCTFYNFTMFASFLGQMILYYDLLVSETQGILYFVSQEVKYFMPFGVGVFLVVLAMVMRYFHEEDYLLGYGVLSMVAYAIFVLWIILRNNPSRVSFPMFEGNFVQLGAAMSQGFSIHNMMIPIILRSQNPQDYKKILINVFVIGGMFYTLVAYGSFGLANRHAVADGSGDTVEDYFDSNQWQVLILRIIYIVNIVTVFPQFLSISKTRFFNMFEQQQQPHHQPQPQALQFPEILYYVLIVGICLTAKIMKLHAPIIIELNGAVICFVEIYLIPVTIHLRCEWRYHCQRDDTQNLEIEHHDQKQSIYKCYPNNCDKTQSFRMEYYLTTQNKEDCPLEQFLQQSCAYHNQLSPTKHYTQTILSLFVLSYGTFVTLYTFYTVFIKQQR